MGFGNGKWRSRAISALVSASALMACLLASAGARSIAAEGPSATVAIPLVCARPTGSQDPGNPACFAGNPVSAIYGTVYVDTDDDGRYNPDLAHGGMDAPVRDATVHLQRAGDIETLTAALSDGYYCFEALDAGEYVVTVALNPEDEIVLSPRDPEPGNVHLLAGKMATRDFRYERLFTPPPIPGPMYSLHLPAVVR